MAEYRISLTMDVVGTGDTEAAAQATAEAQYVDLVMAFNGSYNGEAEPLEGGVLTEKAVLFVRRQIAAHFNEVVVGWRRKMALKAAEAAIVPNPVVME